VPLSAVETAPAPANNPPNPQVPAPPAPPPAASSVNTSTTAADPTAGISSADLGTTLAVPPTPTQDPTAGISSADLGTTAFIAPTDTTAGSSATADIAAGVLQAQQQPAYATQQSQQASSTDWRVKLSLAQNSYYLYNDPNPGILQPLKATGGVIFPYTPKISLSYRANYQPYDLTHANFKGYFYQNSQVSDITINGQFTAQNTSDANYLLAVIHFFRSVTKMFYGQDAQRGTPPPLVFLSGLGQYQFNHHPCVVSNFDYSLPTDVDYIRASVINNVGLNTSTISNVLNSVVASGQLTGYARLAAAFTTPGALPITPFGSINTPNNASGVPTYVPTKMDVAITLHPINSRQQISQQFSLKGFANGNLLRGGFW
jgi:hypothetical protein